MRPFILWWSAALLAVPGLAAAQIYKCTGPGGSVQYSQSRTSANCSEMSEAPPPHNGGDTSAVNRYLDQIDQEQAARSKQQAEAAKDAQVRQQACTAARGRAAVLGQTERVFSTDGNGDRSYLSDQQVDQQRQQANAAVEQLCD